MELLGGFEPPTSSLPSDKKSSSRWYIRLCGHFCRKKDEVENSLLHVLRPFVSPCGSRCGSASDGVRIVTFCVAAGGKVTLWKKYRATSGKLCSRRVALSFYCKFPVWVKMWVNKLYDAKEGRTSDSGNPSRCALPLS